MSVIVVLSPILFFSIFSIIELSFINLKPLQIILNCKGDNKHLAIQKTNKVSTKNFKMDISDP